MVNDLEFQVFGHSSEVLETALDLYKQLGSVVMPQTYEGRLPLHYVIGIDEFDPEFAIYNRVGVPGLPYRAADETTTMPRLFSHIKPSNGDEIDVAELDYVEHNQLPLDLL